MFLNEPHRTHRYYGELLDSYKTRLFSEAHRHLPHVVSGVAMSMMERLFSNDQLPKMVRHFRYQMLMVFRLKFGKGKDASAEFESDG